MLATHARPLPPYSSTIPATKLFSPSYSRPALADSTNVHLRSCAYDPGHLKSFGCPTSVRTGCGWNDFEPSISTSFHPRHHHSSSAHAPFPVTYKAPPTVSISLSEACSQTGPGVQSVRSCGSRAQGVEPDLPHVTSVVPFPSTLLDGDMDVEMLDGTGVSSPSAALEAPRKRRSAHASISSQCGLGKEAKLKRPRKSRRQVAELWWLGVIHRSISRSIEVHRSRGGLESSDSSLRALDHVLIERIHKRLTENGCVEGRALLNPVPRISSPGKSVPSLNLSLPNRQNLPINLAPPALSSETSFKEGSITSPNSNAPSYAPSLITSHSAIASAITTSHRPHLRFEVPQQPRQPQPHPSIPRRSPSPPARTGSVSANPQTLILTMPQLVATLMLASHDRSSLRVRGRSYKVTDCGKNAGRSMSTVPCQADGDAIPDKERTHLSFTPRARQWNAPEKKSPLSRVAYAES